MVRTIRRQAALNTQTVLEAHVSRNIQRRLANRQMFVGRHGCNKKLKLGGDRPHAPVVLATLESVVLGKRPPVRL